MLGDRWLRYRGAAPSPPVPPADWVPPTDQARDLVAARSAGDTMAACAALAMEPLWAGVSREKAERAAHDPNQPVPFFGTRLADDAFELPVATTGATPTPDEDRALATVTLDRVPEFLGERGRLVVDDGRPTAMTLDAASIRAWLARQPGEVARWREERLWTIRGVDEDPETLRGLGCGAWHAVQNGQPWNLLLPARCGLISWRGVLADAWGIRSDRHWQRTLDQLAEPAPQQGDLAFGLRRDIGGGRFVALDEALHVVDEAADHNSSETLETARRELRRVHAYEDYMREHGVLGEGEQVASLMAWDLGRGVHVARAGLAAGFCDDATARWQLRRFGDLARRCYDSWPEYGAALVLGRLLWSADRYDDISDWRGIDVDACLAPMQTLLARSDSPWLTVPFRPDDEASHLDGS